MEDAEVRQEPLTEKQPLAMLSPLLNVEVDPVTLSPPVLTPPVNVDVPNPSTFKRFVVVALPKIVSPVVVEPPPIVEDACDTNPPANVCRALQVLAVVVLKPREKTPVEEL